MTLTATRVASTGTVYMESALVTKIFEVKPVKNCIVGITIAQTMEPAIQRDATALLDGLGRIVLLHVASGFTVKTAPKRAVARIMDPVIALLENAIVFLDSEEDFVKKRALSVRTAAIANTNVTVSIRATVILLLASAPTTYSRKGKTWTRQ